MKKGVATRTLVDITLAILVIVVSGYFLMGPGKDTFNNFLEQLNNLLSGLVGGITEKKMLAAAVQCAYDRCHLGCEKVNDNALIKCKTDFCDYEKNSQWMDQDKKICDFNSTQYPVEIEIKEELKLAKADLKKINCIYPQSGEGFNLGTFLYDAIIGIKIFTLDSWKQFLQRQHIEKNFNLLIIENPLINEDNSQKADCELTGLKDPVKKSFKEVAIRAGKLYISSTSTKRIPLIAGEISSNSTFIYSYPGYKTIELGVENEIIFQKISDVEPNQYWRLELKGVESRYLYLTFAGSLWDKLLGWKRVNIGVGCNYKHKETEVFNVGEKKSFCSDLFEVTYNGVEGEDLKLTVLYKDIDCYERPENQCTDPCHKCGNKRLDINFTMCCHEDEVCLPDGYCKNRPRCYDFSEDECDNNSKYCKSCSKDSQFNICCYINEGCENGECVPLSSTTTTTVATTSSMSCCCTMWGNPECPPPWDPDNPKLADGAVCRWLSNCDDNYKECGREACELT